MANQRRKRPNARKHGVFDATAILPGEDPREFEELHSALAGEWTPASATEEDVRFALNTTDCCTAAKRRGPMSWW
jgi:hypothetical protein